MVSEPDYMPVEEMELRVAAGYAAQIEAARLNTENNVLNDPSQLRGWSVLLAEDYKPGTLCLTLTRHTGNHFEAKVAYCSPMLLQVAQLLGLVDRIPNTLF
jgi:hypothetical protein